MLRLTLKQPCRFATLHELNIVTMSSTIRKTPERLKGESGTLHELGVVSDTPLTRVQNIWHEIPEVRDSKTQGVDVMI